MVTIKDGCGCDPCDCDWKQKLKEAYSRAIQSVNKIGDETGRVYFPDGTGFVKVPLPTKEQIDSIAEIDGIKASVDSLNVTVPALETQVTGVTESLVSNVEVLNGTTAGKFKVRIEREKAALIDSNDYDLSKVNSIELIQGSGPAMVKAQLTLSDGTVLISDDFMFTTESIGQDVYISSFVFKNGNVAGSISANIGLNNGTILEANNFVVPTDPNVLSTIADLTTRTETLEQNVINISQLQADVDDMKVNKADVDNRNQNIKTGSTEGYSIKLTTIDSQAGNKESMDILANSTEGIFDENSPFLVQGTVLDPRGTGKYVAKALGKLALLNSDGTPKNFRAGGDVWEEVNQANWPTDWTADDVIKVRFRGYCSAKDTMQQQTEWGTFTECTLNDPYSHIVYLFNTSTLSMRVLINNYSGFNNGNIGKFMTVSLSNASTNFSYALTSAKNNSDYITIYRLKK